MEKHHEQFDVFHLHFGFDAQGPEKLHDLVDALRRHGKPLVYTVHDLRNPHQVDPSPQRQALDILIPAADRLITLTPGAAAEISRRWNRTAIVLPHPHVIEPARLGRTRQPRSGFRVGVHAKSLRPNMALLPVVRTLCAALAEQAEDTELVVNIHNEVGDPAAHAYAPDVLTELKSLREQGLLTLQVHDYFDDDQLWNYLADLDVSVLPYFFGTHSGWLEACHDLGTTVIAPNCGYYAQQRPCISYAHNQTDGLDEESLQKAILAAYRERPLWQATPHGRATEREQIAAAHHSLYAELVG
ncbi:glycosyltransferase family 1 protein [Streptomyces sp. NPDC095817]|uniref:glycosyltransferase family 1 protein n=1 Tax=Streptomyces sp. NPDC095817 TaxID=3155082 RepID=UPI00332B4AB7